MNLSSDKARHRSIIILLVILILFVASALLLAYLLRDTNWELVRQANPGALFLILALTLLGTLLYTLLVYLLIRGSGYAATLWKTYLVLTASLTANYVTPVNVIAPLRVYMYAHFMGIPIATGAALITVETLVGILAPAFIAVTGIAFLFPALGLAAPLALIMLLIIGLLFLLQAPTQHIQLYLERLPFSRFTVRLTRFIGRVQSGLRCLSPWVIAGVVVIELLMLGSQALRLWLVLNVFGPAPSPLCLLAVLTISVTAGNLSMIPLGLGVRDASFALLLTQLGVPNEIALSAAVIQRLFSPGWPLLLGLISSNALGVEELFLSRPVRGLVEPNGAGSAVDQQRQGDESQ